MSFEGGAQCGVLSHRGWFSLCIERHRWMPKMQEGDDDLRRKTMSNIRTMQEDDLDRVIETEAAAFGAWYRQTHGGEGDTPRRTRTNVRSCLAKDPMGCFVAKVDDQVIGFILSRTWGSVGWFGTFSVLPEWQGQGIGKQLVAASLGYLRQRPGRVIGLSTMPESPYNLGLYLKQGFQMRHLTLFLRKSLVGLPESRVELPRWSQASPATQERWLASLLEASGRIHPGLCYGKEIVVTAQYEQGETVILTEGSQAIGMAVVSLTSGRQGQEAKYGNTLVLALDPTHTDGDRFRALLAGTESMVRARGLEEIVVPVNARHTWALEQLLHWNYRVERAMVRLVLAGTDSGPAVDHHVNLVRWAG
jgi:ribosomal protein S18 acetylase RimI-like enzyme